MECEACDNKNCVTPRQGVGHTVCSGGRSTGPDVSIWFRCDESIIKLQTYLNADAFSSLMNCRSEGVFEAISVSINGTTKTKQGIVNKVGLYLVLV